MRLSVSSAQIIFSSKTLTRGLGRQQGLRRHVTGDGQRNYAPPNRPLQLSVGFAARSLSLVFDGQSIRKRI